MDVTSLYTNIPQEEGIKTICKAYVTHYKDKAPIPTQSLERALRLILKENSFHFYGKNYLQTHGTAMGKKVAVALAKVETELLKISAIKPICWKRYIDDIFSLWGTGRGVSKTQISKTQTTDHRPRKRRPRKHRPRKRRPCKQRLRKHRRVTNTLKNNSLCSRTYYGRNEFKSLSSPFLFLLLFAVLFPISKS